MTEETMREHPNATRAKELFAALERGDLAAIQAQIPQDAVWRFPGRHGKLAGEHRGRPAIFSFLANVVALTGRSFHLELHDVVANDRWAVAIFTGHAEREGKKLNNPTCLRMRIEDGRIRELDEYVWDLNHVEEFWT